MSTRKPMILVLAGPNGSGKSTITQYFEKVGEYTNADDVEARVAQGGHDVEKQKIVSRYEKSLKNIKELLQICDILHVYDNTFEPVRIIRKHKDDISIFANELWDEEKILSLMK